MVQHLYKVRFRANDKFIRRKWGNEITVRADNAQTAMHYVEGFTPNGCKVLSVECLE